MNSATSINVVHSNSIDALKTAVHEGKVELVLDLSRLLARVLHPMPTGVDRVEMAYARQLLSDFPDRLLFSARHPGGVSGRLPRKAVMRFLDECDARWAAGEAVTRNGLRRSAAAMLTRLFPIPPRPTSARRYYLLASPSNLHDAKRMRHILRRECASLICLVHDLIPIEFPEYARSDGATLHRRRLETMATQATALIANSQATADSLRNHLQNQKLPLPIIRAAHLGVNLAPEAPKFVSTMRPNKPYFVMVSTIEPRKNHLLLLNIWRRLVESYGDSAPHLVLIGRRGWENENVVDMLERCPALQHHVSELTDLPDRIVADLLKGARAMLLPSFAEGFGLPVIEALASNVPVLCSDLPALREIAGDVPEFLDPLDGPGWIDAVMAYAKPGSERRKTQIARLDGFRLPSWQAHMSVVLQTIADIDQQSM